MKPKIPKNVSVKNLVPNPRTVLYVAIRSAAYPEPLTSLKTTGMYMYSMFEWGHLMVAKCTVEHVFHTHTVCVVK